MSREGIGRRPPLYRCNWRFFATWSRPMAWILGLWFADGNIAPRRRGYSGVARIGFCDKPLLDLIQYHLESNHRQEIRPAGPCGNTSRRHPFYSLKISSRAMYDDLCALGLRPHKSLTMQFPAVPLEYLADFLRGYWDGDGTVYVTHPKNKITPQLRCDFKTGSEDFARSIVPQFHRLGVQGGSLINTPTGWLVYFGTCDAERIFHIFYDDCPPDMRCQTKYQKFVKCLQARSFPPGSRG